MLEAGLVLQMRRNHPWVRLRRQVIGTGRYIIVVVIVASRLPYEVTGPFMLMGRAILVLVLAQGFTDVTRRKLVEFLVMAKDDHRHVH
jgi:hypothetical protein